ncbi:hypothetical protein N8987_04765 [Crocinitomix sp.]|nr:hypothetical protein [Crocinitomix sp.]
MENSKENKTLKFIENNSIGMRAFFIVFGSCFGSIALMSVLMNSESILLLSICSVLAMVSNAICIAQVEIKLCFRVFLVSVVTFALIILYELLLA